MSVNTLKDRQKTFAERAEDETDPLHLVRNFIGPVHLYDLAPAAQLASRTLPWEDGTWDKGVEISQSGTKVEFDLSQCTVKDMISFLYFYFELNKMNPTKPCTTYDRCHNRLRECLADLIWGETLFEIRNKHA